jgi:hypothetical protein
MRNVPVFRRATLIAVRKHVALGANFMCRILDVEAPASGIIERE